MPDTLSSEDRLEFKYTILDTLGIDHTRLEILKVAGEDTIHVMTFFDLTKGADTAFTDSRDSKKGWNKTDNDGKEISAGSYLFRLTAALSEAYENGFIDTKTVLKTLSAFSKILADLEDNDEMTPSQISEIRDRIDSLINENEKAELYAELQEKVPYHNQRDNISPATEEDKQANPWMVTYNISTAGDIMCNLTSQAMCLTYLGVEPPCSGCSASCDTYTQFEDYLECIRVDKEFDPRTDGAARKDLAELFDVEYQYVNLQGKPTEKIKPLLLSLLRNGHSVMLCGFGHIVRLQAVRDDGVVVDDPYGKMVNFAASGVTPKYKKDGKDYRNGKDFGNAVGEDNFWTWDQFTNKLKVGYGEVYKK